MTEPLMTSAQFETMRLYLIAFTVFYRLLIMPSYLQAYLNLAYDKVELIVVLLIRHIHILSLGPGTQARGWQDFKLRPSKKGYQGLLLPLRGHLAVHCPHDPHSVPHLPV